MQGIFATHLHSLLDLPLRLQRTSRMRMEVAPVEEESDGSQNSMRRPTLRMVPGSCTESLALDVARRQRLPEKVISRAGALYDLLENKAAVLVQEGIAKSPRRNSWALGPPGAESSAMHSRVLPSSDLAEPAVQSLDDAGALMARTAQEVLVRLEAGLSSDGASSHVMDSPPLQTVADSSANPASTETQQEMHPYVPSLGPPRFIRAGQRPPPRTVGLSCIYVVRRSDGWFYVGEKWYRPCV